MFSEQDINRAYLKFYRKMKTFAKANKIITCIRFIKLCRGVKPNLVYFSDRLINTLSLIIIDIVNVNIVYLSLVLL